MGGGRRRDALRREVALRPLLPSEARLDEPGSLRWPHRSSALASTHCVCVRARARARACVAYIVNDDRVRPAWLVHGGGAPKRCSASPVSQATSHCPCLVRRLMQHLRLKIWKDCGGQ